MLKNFFRTASRNITKYKAYSLINFVGLTCGLSLALLIITYVRSEMSFDQFHENSSRLYRFRYDVSNGLKLASTPPPIAPKLKEYFSEVEEAARVYNRNVSVSLPNSTEAFEENSVFFVDSSFTKLFTLEFVKGNSERALYDKYTVVINEEMATKYFGDKNPIGETLIFSGRRSFKVIAVVKDFPENSHLHFNMLVPYDDMFDLEDEQTETILRNNLSINFVISHSYTYVLLHEGTNPDRINEGMDAFVKKYADPRMHVGQVFSIMPVTDIHLKSELLAEPSATNTMTNIYVFMGIGILTLIIASINYINLSTAQSLTRVKEIGIRKILGSMRFHLIAQFLSESFLFCLVSLIIAFGVFYLTLPVLNQFTNKEMEFIQSFDSTLILWSLILLLVITLLAGGYPAYFVTRFESIIALKGSGASGTSTQFLRKVLVIFQLTIASILLSGSLLIMKQLNFLESRPLGFQKNQIINIPLYSRNLNGFFRQQDTLFRVKLQSFRDIVETQTGVKNTSMSSGAPGLGVIYRGTRPEGFTDEDNTIIANIGVDYDFINTYEIDVVAGRNFDRNYGTDVTEAFIVNETAVKEFRWGSNEEAIGKKISREGKEGKVIGVVSDFNFASLTTAVSALVMSIDLNQLNMLSIKFENNNVQSTIEKLESKWNEFFPEKAFEFTFLDEQLNQQYSNYQNFGKIIQSFTLIAILISCLGVYGLVLFTVQRKVKEIGVRKVMGANIGNILGIIYKDFAWLILVGFLLAIPVSYYLLDQWLTNFIYRTNVDVLTYAISLLMIVLVVSLTISYQAIKAAQANPVKSLRSE